MTSTRLDLGRHAAVNKLLLLQDQARKFEKLIAGQAKSPSQNLEQNLEGWLQTTDVALKKLRSTLTPLRNPELSQELRLLDRTRKLLQLSLPTPPAEVDAILRKRSFLTTAERAKIYEVYKTHPPVTKATLLYREKTGASRDILLGPGGQGYVILDRQKLNDHLVGKGAYKEVFCAPGLHDGGDYVVGICDLDEESRPLWRREVFFSKHLAGTNEIIHFILAYEGDLFGYLIMKNYPRSLFQICITPESVPLDKRLEIGAKLFKGLAELHKKRVCAIRGKYFGKEISVHHRDLKPGNVLLDQQNNPVITDLGMAAVEGDIGKFGKQWRTGTYGFRSPEMALGKTSNEKNDVWAMAIIVMNFTLTEFLPWQNDKNDDRVPRDKTWKLTFPKKRYLPLQYAQHETLLKQLFRDAMKFKPFDRISAKEASRRLHEIVSLPKSQKTQTS